MGTEQVLSDEGQGTNAAGYLFDVTGAELIDLRTAPHWADAVMALSSMLTLIAVLFAYVQIRHVNRQMHHDLEMQYLHRFWVLMDRRTLKFRLRGKPQRSDLALIDEHFILSEDQIQLRELGRVTNRTWSYWRSDIRSLCLADAYRARLNGTSPEDFPRIKMLLDDAKFDPYQKSSWMRRMWDGL